MNIIDIQDQLKNFSEQQLISEMQMPSGSAPQFLVLSEIKRRKRVRDDFTKREAANQPTVAEEAVAAAGVPQGGIMGMSEAMAPKSTMVQNSIGSAMPQSMRPQTMPAPTDDAIPMRSGGLAQFGQELSGKVSEGVEPFLDEVEGMAQERFGVDVSGPLQGGIADLSQPYISAKQPIYEIARPNPDFMGRIPFMQPAFAGRRFGKGGPRVAAFNEGGVVRANIGAFFNSDGTPTVAGLKALIAQESGGDPKARGSLDEVGIGQIRPSTALMPGYGVPSMFPEIAAKIGKGKEYATADDAYRANKDLIDAGLEDVDTSTRFTKDYLTAMSKQFPDDPARALAAYNVGPGTAAKLENPAEFDYVTSVLGRMDGGSDEQQSVINMIVDAAKSAGSAVSDSLISPAAASGPVMTEVEPDFDSDLRGSRKRRRDGDVVLTEADRDVMRVADSFQDIQDAIKDAPTLADVSGPVRSPTDVRTDSASRRAADAEFGDEFGNIPLDDEEIARLYEEPVVVKESDLTKGESNQLSRTGKVTGVNKVIREDPSFLAEFLMGETETDETNRFDSGPESGSQQRSDSPDPKSDDTSKSDDSPKADSAAPTGLAKEIADLQAKLEKDRETDKYLALAQAGLALMSSKEPTLLGAIGEAGVSGLTAFREAQDRYQEGVVDLINARAKLRGKGSTFTTNQMIQRANDLQTMAKNLKESDGSEAALQRARELEIAAQGLLVQAGVVGGESSAIAGFQDQ